MSEKFQYRSLGGELIWARVVTGHSPVSFFDGDGEPVVAEGSWEEKKGDEEVLWDSLQPTGLFLDEAGEQWSLSECVREPFQPKSWGY